MMKRMYGFELPVGVQRSIGDKSYDGRKRAALEVEKLVINLAKNEQEAGKAKIFDLVGALASHATGPSSPNTRKGALLCLAAAAVGLSAGGRRLEGFEQDDFMRRVAPPILAACTDPDNRIRYYALEALYNVAKSTRPAILIVFHEIFDILFRLCSDPDRSVQNAASILDDLIKTCIAETPSFDVDAFLPKLSGCLAIPDSSQQRQFLLGWVSLLDGLPYRSGHLLRALPQLLPGMLAYLDSEAPEVRAGAGKLLGQLSEDVAETPSLVDVAALAEVLTTWLADAEAEARSDEEPRPWKKGARSAVSWLRTLLLAAAPDLSKMAAPLLRACLQCLDTPDTAMQALGGDLNEDLMEATELLNTADVGELLEEAAEGIGALQETAKLEALRWTATLLQLGSERGVALQLDSAVLPALCDALSSTSDKVVYEATAVLAVASGAGSEGLRRALSSVLGCFRGALGAHLLQRRGATIVEQMCRRMGARQVTTTLAALLADEPDLEFGRMMAQAACLMLLTSPELQESRNLLASADASVDFLTAIFPGFSHSVAAALSVAFLAQAFPLASAMISKLTEQPLLAEMASSAVELGQLTTLLEAPAFAPLRLQLLAPRRHPGLLRALYSLLLVLPQGEAFRTLRSRLDCVPSPSVAGQEEGWLEDGQLDDSQPYWQSKMLGVFVETQARRAAIQSR